MGAKGSSEQTRREILNAARQLFATRGINEVSVRDIAAWAGVTHALVHRYFGTKEEILGEIVRREVEAASALPVAPDMAELDPLEVIRRMLLFGLTDARTSMLLITRAELAGVEPEKMLDDTQYRPLGLLSDWLKQQQGQAAAAAAEVGDAGPDQTVGPLPDPALVSAIIGGALFSLQALGPWLMTAVGLDPQDASRRRDEIVDILLDIVVRAAGPQAKKATGEGTN
jgi:AcrR family transcriptional regulator